MIVFRGGDRDGKNSIYVCVGDTYYIRMNFQEATNYNILVKLGMLLQPLVFVMGFGLEVH